LPLMMRLSDAFTRPVDGALMLYADVVVAVAPVAEAEGAAWLADVGT